MQDQRQLYIDAQNYFTGDGGRWQDRRRAIDLLKQVCYNFASPIPSAARMLANCLETGQGVEKDLDEAIRLYQSIGDRQGLSRCGYPVSSVPSSSRPAPAPRAVASVASPPARNAGAAVGAPRPRAQPAKASVPQPNPLPLHIERIVLQVSPAMPLRIVAQKSCCRSQLRPNQNQSRTPALPSPAVSLASQDAERSGCVCSISYEVITLHNGAVTSCGHIFLRCVHFRAVIRQLFGH